jgi:uncharacterized protein with PIN domain
MSLAPEPTFRSVNRPKFLADEMLGRLAKWLRLLGYDTVYVRGISDSHLIERAAPEDRIILTRDTRLILRKRCHNYIFIHDDDWRNQLLQVYNEVELNMVALFTICPVCNELLRQAEKDSIEAVVPSYVYDTQETFAVCHGCSRVFWAATHAKKIISELEQLGVVK